MNLNPAFANGPQPRHTPVMLAEVLAALHPESGGVFIDGTFGAGGYTRGLLQSEKSDVIAIDRDPSAIAAGQKMAEGSGGRLKLVHGRFSQMEEIAHELGIDQVQGVVLDIGVSSMQLDEAARGFSFSKDGPLDMRMANEGISAHDVINKFAVGPLADLIYDLGEEARSRAIAKAIVKARTETPITTTFALVKAIEKATGPQRATDRIHPATKTFQALRIFVNDELEELAHALTAAEAVLVDGGRLVVVTFHSLEDRIVKRFFAARAGKLPKASRHAPETDDTFAPRFTQEVRGAVLAGEAEIRDNPRARSAKLRWGVRTAAPSEAFEIVAPGLSRTERH